jgi:hypothetical protein
LLSLFDAELAKDELELRGYSVLGGYMSPVNDAYKKKVHVMYGLAKKSIWNCIVYADALLTEFRFESCVGPLTGCSPNSLL